MIVKIENNLRSNGVKMKAIDLIAIQNIIRLLIIAKMRSKYVRDAYLYLTLQLEVLEQNKISYIFVILYDW